MVKREDSTRSLGFVTVATDKPTRDKLKEVARLRGMPLTEYLRVVADEGLKGKQLSLPGSPTSPTQVVNKKLDIMADAIDGMAMAVMAISEAVGLDKAFYAAFDAYEALKAISSQRKAREVRQGELSLEGGL